LKLSPDLNTLTGAPSGEAKDQQQPWSRLRLSYSHSGHGIHITNVCASDLGLGV
jgi:hypothetical protein